MISNIIKLKNIYTVTGIFIICLFLNGLPDISFSQSTWFWQQPVPTGNQLNSVKFVNSNTGYAVGTVGTIIKTTNVGANWVSLNSGVDEKLTAVFFTDPALGYACGDSGTIVKTTNGGDSWTKLNTGTVVYLHDICFPAANTGYAVGGSGVILKTTNSGQNWTFQNSGYSGFIFSVSFANTEIGYAGPSGGILQTTNGGLNWSFFNLGINPMTQLIATQCIDLETVYTVDDGNGFYKTTNGGLNWSLVLLGIPASEGSFDIIRGASFINANTGFIATDLGRILRTTNAGVIWQQDSTYLRYDNRGDIFSDVNMTDTGSVTVVGTGGRILSSSNLGVNWQIQSGFRKHLRSNYFTSVNTGYSVGDSGRILKTTDGGSNWILQSSPIVNILNSVFFASENTGYVAGDSGVILKTTNGGNNWLKQISGSSEDLYSIHFINEIYGMTCGKNSKVLKTTNGGQNWIVNTITPFDYFNSIYLIDANTGIMATDIYTFRTTDGGSNWNRQSGGRGRDLTFINSDTGILVGGGNGIYRSTNTGINWIQQTVPTGFAIYNSVHFINVNTGFAVGEDGKAVKTTDGGANWFKILSITENTYNSVKFVNSSTGYITGMFGTLLKTTNGGATFIIEGNNLIANNFELSQNYPNPFNPNSTVDYTIPARSIIRLSVFDISGKKVKTLINKDQLPGKYSVRIDGSLLPSGIYFYSLYSNEVLIKTKKCILLK